MLNALIKRQVDKVTIGELDNNDNNTSPDLSKSRNGEASDGASKQNNPFNNLDKKSKYDLVNKLKNEVPTVLLNKWLEISPERSRFAVLQKIDSDEYSSYSDSTISNQLSIKDKSLNRRASQFNNQLKIPGLTILLKGLSEQRKESESDDNLYVERERRAPKSRSSKIIESINELDSCSNISKPDLNLIPVENRLSKNQLLAPSDYSVSD